MQTKKYKGKVRCMSCGASMVYFTQSRTKLICSNYHKGLIERCPERFTVDDSDIDDILDGHNIEIEEVYTIYINKDMHYRIIMKDNSEKYWDGSTLVL